MARMARVVAPHYPHHVTQRGNRRQKTFFCQHDYRCYVELIAEFCSQSATRVWSYCLMPNHVHLVLVPSDEHGLKNALAEAHRRYTRRINLREGWRGHLWQERFFSCPMDEQYLLATARYVEMNPVRAGLCANARDWPWSSARAHLHRADDALVEVAPLLAIVPDWEAFLADDCCPAVVHDIERSQRSGRPLGSESFIDDLERITGRSLRKRSPGPVAQANNRD